MRRLRERTQAEIDAEIDRVDRALQEVVSELESEANFLDSGLGFSFRRAIKNERRGQIGSVFRSSIEAQLRLHREAEQAVLAAESMIESAIDRVESIRDDLLLEDLAFQLQDCSNAATQRLKSAAEDVSSLESSLTVVSRLEAREIELVGELQELQREEPSE